MMFYLYLKNALLYSNYAACSYKVADSNYSANCSGSFDEFPLTKSVQREAQLLLGIQTQHVLILLQNI
jgi:hypothetical protein